jgi:hypothetical protein
VTFKIFKAFPPDRDSPVAELCVLHDGLIDIPADIYREKGELRITLFARQGGAAWDYPVEEFLEAVQRGVERLGEG